MVSFRFLAAVLVAASADELADSENCFANATHSEDCVAKGSPLMQKAVSKSINSHRDTRRNIQIEGLPIDDGGNRGQWESFWDLSVASLTMVDPIRPDDKMLNDSLNDGTIDRRYKSWYMPGGPASGEQKFYHEVGVTMAHRKAWQTLIDKAQGDGDRYGLIFEGDADLRADFWRWIRHLKEEVLAKGDRPFMIWLGYCFEGGYDKDHGRWQANDFCLEGAEDNNPHNVSGCLEHYEQGICPVAYLISLEGARNMMDITTPMNCAIDEKFRYEIQRNNWDARIMWGPIARQPWQHEMDGSWKENAEWESEKQQKGYSRQTTGGRLMGEMHEANICGPPGDWVREIHSWP